MKVQYDSKCRQVTSKQVWRANVLRYAWHTMMALGDCVKEQEGRHRLCSLEFDTMMWIEVGKCFEARERSVVLYKGKGKKRINPKFLDL